MRSDIVKPLETPIDRIALGIVAPLGLMALGYVGGQELGRLLPTGLATIAQVAGVALWSAAPIVAGISWASMSSSSEKVVAAAVGVGITLGWLLRLSASSADWSYGALQTPTDWLPLVLLFAVLNGVGLSVAGGLAASLFRSHHPWWAGIIGVACAWAIPLTAFLVSGMLAIGLADR
jgi:hypothetical protein